MIQKDVRILERRTKVGAFNVMVREAETDDQWLIIGANLSPNKVGQVVKALLQEVKA